ncbi:holocytochrome c synthase [Marasmius tenuissimus]|nr:holocytochrome c synthase [Marasmius tenuissimus]
MASQNVQRHLQTSTRATTCQLKARPSQMARRTNYLSSVSHPLYRVQQSLRLGINLMDNWEYPSPQQFHNALLRKGYNTPENQAESMVFIHNELNEYAWGQVVRWESRFHGGEAEAAKLQLASFSGIHGHLSNKARLFRYGKRVLPSYFTLPDPFDRHDWIVRRPTSGQEARYVIDYYRLKDEEGDDAFYMDVRPAFDSVSNASARIAAVVLDKVASASGTGKTNQWSVLSSVAVMTVMISGCLIVPIIGRR